MDINNNGHDDGKAIDLVSFYSKTGDLICKVNKHEIVGLIKPDKDDGIIDNIDNKDGD